MLNITMNSYFSETRSHFMEKMLSGFPSDVRPLLCLNSVIHGGSLKQHVGCLQTEAAAAAPDDIFPVKCNAVLLNSLFCVTHYFVNKYKLCFSKSQVTVKVTYCYFKLTDGIKETFLMV